MLESVQSEFAKKFASHTRTTWVTEAVEDTSEDEFADMPVFIKELALETGNDFGDLTNSEETSPGVYNVSFGHMEYLVAENDDIADKLCLQTMEDFGVDSFSHDFVKHYVSVLPTDARIIALEEIDAKYDGDEDRDEDAEMEETRDLAKQIEEDPISYFCDNLGIYSEEDLMKQSWIHIDTDRMFKDAMDSDGRGNYLASDLEEIELPSGGFAYRLDD